MAEGLRLRKGGGRKTVYLFSDTETTGIPRNYNAPVSDLANWPRMIQIAWPLAGQAPLYLDWNHKRLDMYMRGIYCR